MKKYVTTNYNEFLNESKSLDVWKDLMDKYDADYFSEFQKMTNDIKII